MYKQVYNLHFREVLDLMDRYQMDRRRLKEAHFQFAILQTAFWCPQHLNINALALHGSTKNTLLDVVSIYHGVFMAQYASEYPFNYCMNLSQQRVLAPLNFYIIEIMYIEFLTVYCMHSL